MLTKQQRYGLRGEEWAAAELEARGYHTRLISDYFDEYDLIVNGCLPVEVKRRRAYRRQVRPGYYRDTWHFSVSGLVPDQDYIVILIAETKAGILWPYVIPSWYCQTRWSVSITSHPRQYSGMWAGFLHQWGNIDYVISQRARLKQSLQLPLIFGQQFAGQNSRVSQREAAYV